MITSDYSYSVLDRFLKYVQIDTQSDADSPSQPSTAKQLDLGKILVEELLALGITDAHLDEFGYVYATLASNVDFDVPVICYCSHMDTSPDCSGKGVKPIVHMNYKGYDIVLPDDNSQVLRITEHEDLEAQIGNDIVTASGTTLLGADNKAGLAEIMDFVQFATQNPEFKHGEIRILFTPDEEIGRGVNKVDIKKLNARYGFTVDGESLGSIENETFSADAATVTLHGISSHPGFAKGKMVNSLKVAAAFLEALPKGDLSPETTSGKEGFVHPMQVQGNLEKSEIKFILRDFSTPKLKEQATMLGEIAEQVCKEYPGSSFTLSVTEQYRNMKEVIDLHPTLISNVEEAMVRAGITPKLSSIRGGTDGSRLSFMGLPCPNIFAGEHAFHSKQEWVSVQDMQRAVDTLINLAAIFAEKAQD